MGRRRLIPAVVSLLLVWLAGCNLLPSAPPKHGSPLTVTMENDEGDDPNFVFYAAYPVTGQGKIDDVLAGYAKGVIGEFLAKLPSRQPASPTTGVYTGIRPELDVLPAVTANTGAAFGVMFDKGQNPGGGTFSGELHNYVFAVADGKPITIGDIFRDKAGFARILSDKVTAALKKKFATEIRQTADAGNPDFVDKFIAPGAGPDAAHFSNFIVRGGNLEIWFDKYQVAPGYYGNVDVQIPLSELKDSTIPSVIGLFDENRETARPGEEPSPSSAATTAPVPSTPKQSAPVDCRVKRCLALTFDDGPTPYTETLLDTFKKNGAHATFFVVGQSVEGRAATMRRMVAEGHEIGNHTWNHPQLPRMSPDDVRRQVQDTQDAVERVTGVRPKLFRPPYSAINAADKAALGLPVVLWTVDPADWKNPEPAILTSTVLGAAAPGVIVDLHDNRHLAVQAMETLVPALIQAGYTLVTVSELLAPSVPAAGAVVTRR